MGRSLSGGWERPTPLVMKTLLVTIGTLAASIAVGFSISTSVLLIAAWVLVVWFLVAVLLGLILGRAISRNH